jgi:cyclopropane-fatty-acyl-phospholipid synthase
VRHHYDLPPEFFQLFLGESLAYSCAIFSRGAKTLEEAQTTKLDLVCTKLNLQPGQRVLDVGCGWGAGSSTPRRTTTCTVTGITLSEPQARIARERAEAAGVGDKVDIRVQDYREIAGEQFDAIASIGMVEHVGENQMDVYAERLRALLPDAGVCSTTASRGSTRTRPTPARSRSATSSRTATRCRCRAIELALERAASRSSTSRVQGRLRRDAAPLGAAPDENIEEATRLAGEERVRVWRLYLRAARNGFETGFTSIYQVRCHAAS